MIKGFTQESLVHLISKIKDLIPTSLSELTNDTKFVTQTDIANKLDTSTAESLYAKKTELPTAVTVDSALSNTSTNPVQNKVINTALNGKLDKGSGFTITSNENSPIQILRHSSDETSSGLYGAESIQLNEGSERGLVISPSTIIEIRDSDRGIKGISFDSYDNGSLYVYTKASSASSRVKYPLATESYVTNALTKKVDKDYVNQAIAAIASYDDTAF